MITPGGIKYEQEEDELDFLFDLPMLVSDQKPDFPKFSGIQNSEDIAQNQSILRLR